MLYLPNSGKYSIIYIMKRMAGIGKIYREKLGRVLESNPSILTPSLVSEVLKVSTQEAGRILSRWLKNGWVSRIKRGVYIPIPLTSKIGEVTPEEPNLIAEAIYGLGYIAGFTAVKHWDLSEQIIESITYFTIKKTRDRHPTHGGIKFKIKTISRHKIFGLKNIWYGSHKVKVSDPTKTIIDMLDDPKIVGGIQVVNDILIEYIESDFFEPKLLIEYGKKMKNKSIFKRLGFLLQVGLGMKTNIIKELKRLISPSYSNLDSTLNCEYFINEWKLKVSKSWKLEYDRKS